MKTLLIATTNSGKIIELRALLADLPVDIVTPTDIKLDLDVIEDGLTYAENAAKKATAFARASGIVSLADDSGLEVDALGGAPGLYSARYGSILSLPPFPREMGGVGGGLVRTDKDRRAHLLQNILVCAAPRPWRARFVATVAVSGADGSVEWAQGECGGEIIPEERGTGGFGYDSIFLFPALGLTMAELSDDEKNKISHRARAVQAAKPILSRWLRR